MEWVIGIGAAIVVLVVAASLCFKGAPCPKCGKGVVLGSPSQCPHCLSFWVESNGAHAPLPPGFFVESIDVFPPFKTKLSELVPTSDLRLPWRGRCCVCGEPSTRAEALQFRYAAGGFPPTEQVIHYDVEHCGRHKNGVWYEQPFERLVFKSHDYWREFLALNLQIRQSG